MAINKIVSYLETIKFININKNNKKFNVLVDTPNTKKGKINDYTNNKFKNWIHRLP